MSSLRRLLQRCCGRSGGFIRTRGQWIVASLVVFVTAGMGSPASSGSGGETQWVQTVEGTGWSSSVTVDQDGLIHLLSVTGPYLVPPHIPLVLNKYSPSGELLWSRTFETPGTPIAVD